MTSAIDREQRVAALQRLVDSFQRRVDESRAAGRVELHVDLDTAELLGKLAKAAADAYAKKGSAP